MDDEKLLPCPFCKQAVHIIKGTTEGSCDWIEHLSPTEECGLEFSDFNLTGELATAWNTRSLTGVTEAMLRAGRNEFVNRPDGETVEDRVKRIYLAMTNATRTGE